MIKNLQCPICFNGSLSSNIRDYYLCTTCNQRFEIFDNVPYLGRFYESDLKSVMEITSILTQINLDNNLSTFGNQKPEELRLGYLKIQKMVKLSIDELGSNINFPDFGYDKTPPWFTARYNEYKQFSEVLGNINFKNKRILDVGAGTGFDSLRFVNMGAKVTALEYNPLQASYGAKSIKNITWLGGSATHIPFENETFDFVISNAALHHIVDLEIAINEMLRVLKPGGKMITLADSFSPDDFTEEREVDVFQNHSAVLRGVNEQLPKLKYYIDPLINEGSKLKVKLYTPVVHGLHKREKKMRIWSLREAKKILSNYRGGLCMEITKLKSTTTEKRKEKKVIIEFSDYVSHLTSRSNALNRLRSSIPKHAIDFKFNDENQQKLKLLMGWKPFSKSRNYQVGVLDSYLYCSEEHITRYFSKFYLAIPNANEQYPRQISIFINCKLIKRIEFYDKNWKEIILNFDAIQSVIEPINLVRISINKEGNIESNSFLMSRKKTIYGLFEYFFHSFTNRLIQRVRCIGQQGGQHGRGSDR